MDNANALYKAWQHLSDDDRNILEEYYGSIFQSPDSINTTKRTLKEIAKEKGVSHPTIHQRIKDALLRLGRLIESPKHNYPEITQEGQPEIWDTKATDLLQQSLDLVSGSIKSIGLPYSLPIRQIRIYKQGSEEVIKDWPKQNDELWLSTEHLKVFVHIWTAIQYLINQMARADSVDMYQYLFRKRYINEAIISLRIQEELDEQWLQWRDSTFGKQ